MKFVTTLSHKSLSISETPHVNGQDSRPTPDAIERCVLGARRPCVSNTTHLLTNNKICALNPPINGSLRSTDYDGNEKLVFVLCCSREKLAINDSSNDQPVRKETREGVLSGFIPY